MNITIIDLTNIFYSRPGLATIDKQAISDILFLLEHQYLCVTKKILCDKENFFSTLEKLHSGEIAIFDFQGGKIEHVALKAIVYEYVLPQTSAQIEAHYHNRIPDVMYTNGADIFIVECGNTDAQKILEYFSDSCVKEVSIVPFPYADEEEIYLYTFSPSENLADFISFLEEERRKKLKAFLRKR